MAELLADNKKVEKKAKKEKNDNSSDDDEPKKKLSKKDKKKQNTSDDDEPKKKKGPTGYLLYSNMARNLVKQQLETKNGEKPKSTEVMKELGVAWKALTDDEREEWNNKATQLKDDA
jgi:high mobility group protein B1/high mobility group protein B3